MSFPWTILYEKQFSISVKDKTLKENQINTIYQVPCFHYSNSAYIGETRRYLKRRMYEQEQKMTPAIQSYAKDLKRNFDFNKVKILETEQNENERGFN